jgi:two-component system, chemotaxis family, chemotaxis protein CheY
MRIRRTPKWVASPKHRPCLKPQNRYVKLLIVEENGAMSRLLGTLLEGLPISVSQCNQGTRALDACADLMPDYVAIDLDLAGVDALAAVRQMVAAHPGLRVLLLGEEDDARLRGRAAEAGVWRYVLKESLIDVRHFLEAAEVGERLNE